MLIDYLASKNIHTSVHFKPLHKYNVVKSMNQREYPVADVEWKKLISLPCHPGMNDEDIDYVSDKFFNIHLKDGMYACFLFTEN